MEVINTSSKPPSVIVMVGARPPNLATGEQVLTVRCDFVEQKGPPQNRQDLIIDVYVVFKLSFC